MKAKALKWSLGIIFLSSFILLISSIDFLTSVFPGWNTTIGFEKYRADKKLGIQVYEGFDPGLTESIRRSVQQTYGIPVYLLPSRELPKNAFVNLKSARYRADSLLLDLKRSKPDSIDHLLGLCSKDISTTKRDLYGKVKEPAARYQDWGVFGLGYRPGPACVVSSFRLMREPKEKFVTRLSKVCIHEFGHNLGLAHCKNPQCVLCNCHCSSCDVCISNCFTCNGCIGNSCYVSIT